MKEKWINNLQKKMESHEEPEPLGLWDDIESALIAKKSSPIFNYKKAILWTTSMAGIAAMLALIFFIGKEDASMPTTPANITSQVTEQTIQESTTNQNQNNSITQPLDEKKELLANNTIPYNQKKEISNTEPESNAAIVDKEDITEKLANDNIEERQQVENKDPVDTQIQSEKGRENENNNLLPRGSADDGSIDNYDFRRTSATNKGRLIASAYSTNLPNTSGESSGYGELIAKATLPGQMSANAIREQGPAEDIIFSNIGEETITKTEHKQPLKAGLSLRYQLSDKFGIESGVTYTYLSSSLSSGTSKNLYETEQSLQYIGIPLNIMYNIWDNKQMGFYLSGGGLVEKNISGKSHTNYIINNKIELSEERKIKDGPLQFSVNSAVGFQYNASSLLGVFVEPGIGYYFNNGSEIETIYKDKPLNFNLKIGLRFNIK